MKKALSTLFVLWLYSLAVNPLNAQYHEVKLDAGGLVVGSYGFGYEYGINDDMGVNFRVGFFDSESWLDFDDNSYGAFSLLGEYRYYLDYDEGADGYFVGAYLKYRNVNAENYYSEYDPNTGDYLYADYKSSDLGIGFSLGWKTVTYRGFLVETYGGIGRYIIQNENIPDGYEEYDGLSIPLDVRIGIVLGWRLGT
jgi:hypothetical protein